MSFYLSITLAHILYQAWYKVPEINTEHDRHNTYPQGAYYLVGDTALNIVPQKYLLLQWKILPKKIISKVINEDSNR